MLNNFKNEDFERFLKQSADGLRMRPSDGVWNKINRQMNRRRRGVVITSAVFLLTASFFGYYLVDSAKSLHDPMATSNIIQEPATSTFHNTPNTNNVTTRTTTKQTAAINSSTTAAAAEKAPANTTGINHVFIPALVAALPLFEQFNAASVLKQFEDGDQVFDATLVDEYQPNTATAEGNVQVNTPAAKNEYPYTIESVVNLYKRQFKSPKTEWQFIFTPTISYRNLSENKSFLRQVPLTNTSLASALRTDVNKMVNHKPALGLEVGMAFKYRVSNSLKLRSGLQFNISRYDIKAHSTYQPELATIALNNNSGIDSINTLTRFRNVNVNSVTGDWLENSYFQVSMPVGAELRLFGNKNTHVGIATTVQPTYVLGERAYLISTDYKSYSQVPSLTRRWNVHTAVETYIGYTTGKLAWQVGPQVRYQLLSSFDREYPVKENLFDFGLKVGVSLNKQ